MLREASLTLASVAVLSVSSPQLAQSKRELPREILEEREALMLPRGELLHLFSFGYRLVAADILWFNTINYFGKHFRTDKNYRWLFHMCDLVTTLNPRARHVYTFGATMLSWEGSAAAEATRLLTKAIEHFPKDWELYYLRGFTEMYFLQNTSRAHEDFVVAAKLPGAHVVVQRLAAKKLSELSGPAEAARFLEDLIQGTEDPVARAALSARLRELQDRNH